MVTCKYHVRFCNKKTRSTCEDFHEKFSLVPSHKPFSVPVASNMAVSFECHCGFIRMVLCYIRTYYQGNCIIIWNDKTFFYLHSFFCLFVTTIIAIIIIITIIFGRIGTKRIMTAKQRFRGATQRLLDQQRSRAPRDWVDGVRSHVASISPEQPFIGDDLLSQPVSLVLVPGLKIKGAQLTLGSRWTCFETQSRRNPCSIAKMMY